MTNIDIDAAVAIFRQHLRDVRGHIGPVKHRDDWRALPKIKQNDLIADLVNEQLNHEPEAFVETCVKLEKA